MSRYLNRELSWLDFNLRVLKQAQLERVPLFEKLRFVSIFQSNLDEFYMVRVGSLYDQLHYYPNNEDSKTKWNAEKQLLEIGKKTKSIIKKKDEVFDNIIEHFKRYKFVFYRGEKIEKDEASILSEYFNRQIEPFVTPYIIDDRHPFLQFNNNLPYVVVALNTGKNKQTYGIVSYPESLPNTFIYDYKGQKKIILIYDLILIYTKQLFSQYKIVDQVALKVIRSADLDYSTFAKDEDESYLEAMLKLLVKRKRLHPVKLVLSKRINKDFTKFLNENIKVDKNHIFYSTSPLNYKFLSLLENNVHSKNLDIFYPPFYSKRASTINLNKRIIPQVSKKDHLLIYPYQSDTVLLKLLEEAANNPDVVSIKITLYRLAPHSKVIDSLVEAAIKQKEVTVYLELQARFDEENNIHWSNKLEESLVNVVYGFENYKVHSKALLITFKDQRKIAHLGTGNYNEQTSRLYTDVNLFTSDTTITSDLAGFFNSLASGQLEFNCKELLVAPVTLKSTIIRHINNEIVTQSRYGNGRIIMKMNSLTDKEIIDALYEAADSGVKVTLVVRGICCIYPNNNIEIYSVLGRFLEHARIYYFHSNRERNMYISSADMMTRNTEKRIEVAVPIKNNHHKDVLLEYLKGQTSNPHTFKMNAKGQYNIINRYSEEMDSQTEMIDNQTTDSTVRKYWLKIREMVK